MDAGRGDPSDTGYGHGAAVREWRAAEGSTDVSSKQEAALMLPPIEQFDPRDYAQRSLLAMAAGHELSIEQTRRKLAYPLCSCGWEGRTYALATAAIEEASAHILRVSSDILEFARRRHIELQLAAAEIPTIYPARLVRQRSAHG